jgi:alpha-L-rhamnosidase
VAALPWAEASYHSSRRPVASRRERAGSRLTLTVSIPANTTATVFVPKRCRGPVTEGGAETATRPGIASIRSDDGAAVFQIQSGLCVFTSCW